MFIISIYLLIPFTLITPLFILSSLFHWVFMQTRLLIQIYSFFNLYPCFSLSIHPFFLHLMFFLILGWDQPLLWKLNKQIKMSLDSFFDIIAPHTNTTMYQDHLDRALMIWWDVICLYSPLSSCKSLIYLSHSVFSLEFSYKLIYSYMLAYSSIHLFHPSHYSVLYLILFVHPIPFILSRSSRQSHFILFTEPN